MLTAYIIIVRMSTSIIEYYNNYYKNHNYCVLGRVLTNSIVVITASLFITIQVHGVTFIE